MSKLLATLAVLFSFVTGMLVSDAGSGGGDGWHTKHGPPVRDCGQSHITCFSNLTAHSSPTPVPLRGCVSPLQDFPVPQTRNNHGAPNIIDDNDTGDGGVELVGLSQMNSHHVRAMNYYVVVTVERCTSIGKDSAKIGDLVTQRVWIPLSGVTLRRYEVAHGRTAVGLPIFIGGDNDQTCGPNSCTVSPPTPPPPPWTRR